MGYVEKALTNNEQFIYAAKFHWYYTLNAFSILIVGGLVALAGGWWVLAFVVGFVIFLYLMIVKWTTEIAVTNQRVIYKRGWIARSTDEISLGKVEELNLRQGILGRILGFGKVRIQGTGIGQIELPNIDDPLLLRKHVLDAQQG